MTNNTYFVSLDTRPFDKIELSLKATYTNSKMGFDPITHWEGPYDEIEHLDFGTFGEVNEYSDLNDGILDLKFNLRYLVNENLSVLFEGNYSKFDDNQSYVYGDTSGKWFYGKFTVRYTF